MKKLLKVLIILLTISMVDVEAISGSDLTVLNLNQITTKEKPKHYTSVQGGTTTDKYVITLFIDEHENSSNKTAISVLDKDTYKKVKLENNPIKEYDFKHSNDATYNSKTNELLVLCGKSIAFLDLNDDKFTLTRTRKLKKYYHGLGYDAENDQYVLARTIKDGTLFEIRDSEFNIIRKFKLKTNLTRQSLTVYKGNIYYVCYQAGRTNKYQDTYDPTLKRKENLIYVYDLKGKKQNIYYIPYDYNDIIFGEIENISFNNDKMLIQFNHANKAGYFTAEYRDEINAIISVRVDDGKSKSNTYSLYEDNKEIQVARSDNNQVTYHFRYYEEGIYKYKIKRKGFKEKTLKDDLLENDYEQTETDLEVEVYYDPVVNRLKVRTNSPELIFTNNKLYNEAEYRRVDKTLVIDVPDTSSYE